MMTPIPSFVLALGIPGMWEWIVIGGLGLLIFGKRLPDVGRAMGQMFWEFKRGLKGIEEGIDLNDDDEARRPLPPPGKANPGPQV